MKFSIAWIFDHLGSDWQSLSINDIVQKFNRTTAEIERVVPWHIDLDAMSIVQVISCNADHMVTKSIEWDQEIAFEMREGTQAKDLFLVRREPTGIRFATLADLGSAKDGLVPALFVDPSLIAGGWKHGIPASDYVIEVDNKSITHRPDLWGHRGMAREIGAMFGILLKPLEDFLDPIPVARAHTTITSNSGNNKITLANHAEKQCKSIAALDVALTEPRACDMFTLFRLARVDARPINAVVDITNYVMFDIGAPMHAFDAKVLQTNKLDVRLAAPGEKLALLDGETIALTPQDVVISNGKYPVSLAGIMGGKASGVTSKTMQVLLEAGCFDAGTIRHTATRIRKRTEASVRFEKSLDPNQPIFAIKRFLALANNQELLAQTGQEIICVGQPAACQEITLEHQEIESALGISVSPEQVVAILQALECGVVILSGSTTYQITVPPFRATKDVTIKEDIIEEVGRFYGYDTITPKLLVLSLKPWDMTPVMRVRNCKQFLAYGLRMQEVYNYALYDEHFLQILGWQPKNAAQVQSPISEHWQRPVTSLIPHLLKNVQQNATYHDSLRFFEWGRTWSQQETTLTERKILAGIIAHQKEDVNFYTAQQELQCLFAMLHMEVSWTSIAKPEDPWYLPYESAYIMHKDICVGKAGKVDPTFLHKVVEGDAFIFELDGDFLINYREPVTKFVPISKYQTVTRDISVMVPLAITVDQILGLVRSSNTLLQDVYLVDYFINDAWHDRKAVTIRCILQDSTKTLTKEDVDTSIDAIIKIVERLGATVR